MISLDDIVYYTSMLVCLPLGNYYSEISDPDVKRNYGAGVGILIACVVCGNLVFYSMFMVSINIVIIRCCDKRYVHQVSFVWTWLYLLYMYLNVPSSVYVQWIHRILALRVVGLAFEVYRHERNLKMDSKSANFEMEELPEEPAVIDILCYAYYFAGIHKGPYYTWKVYKEHLTSLFGVLADSRVITEEKLKKALIWSIAYFIIKITFTNDIYTNDEFYEHGSDYRFVYNIPHLLLFLLEHQMLMFLCTSVCTEAGFGMYPAKCQAYPGCGASANFDLLKKGPSPTEPQEYNFSMLKCFDLEMMVIGPRMKDTMKGWNMDSRYWFWVNTFNNLIKSNREVRSACSFFAWTIWCGPSLQQAIVSITLWMYVHLEQEYSELCNTTQSMKMPWDIGFSIMRLFCLIYLTPCLAIQESSVVLRYYNSIFWVYHIVLLMLTLVAMVIYKMRLK